MAQYVLVIVQVGSFVIHCTLVVAGKVTLCADFFFYFAHLLLEKLITMRFRMDRFLVAVVIVSSVRCTVLYDVKIIVLATDHVVASSYFGLLLGRQIVCSDGIVRGPIACVGDGEGRLRVLRLRVKGVSRIVAHFLHLVNELLYRTYFTHREGLGAFDAQVQIAGLVWLCYFFGFGGWLRVPIVLLAGVLDADWLF